MRPHLATYLDDFRRYGPQTALVAHRGNRRITSTYSDLAHLADRFAAELLHREIPMGERVLIYGQSGLQWIAAFFGCVQRGVLAVPLDAAGSLDFARRILADTRPRLIVGDAQLLSALATDTPSLAFENFDSALPREVPANLREPMLTLDTPLQILFTSGTTTEPKGIVHTHRNVLSSLDPIEREIPKYLKYERFVHPLRFLHTLPLSHVFGEFMGLWIPPLLAAEVHFETRLQAQRLTETIRRERISVLAAVPRVLDLLRAQLLAQFPALPQQIAAAHGRKIWVRFWRFRRIHRSFGYKFWAFVCGGASLPSELEGFWNTLGFALIQGYGMTETAALITLNHPFKTAQGSIGKVLPGRDVQITPEGEIQVRGDMVSGATWRGGQLHANESPWLATGDLASRDEEGRLHFLGRKSQVIVTAAGLNIHPEDIESALNKQPGVEASAVVPRVSASGSEPVAVLRVRGGSQQAEEAVFAANQQLADFQRIRQWHIWPELDLPRTSTGKIQRRTLTAWVNAQRGPEKREDSSDPLLALILSITHRQPTKTGDDARLDEDLGLDSLGRVQLQGELEQRLGLSLGDTTLEGLATLGDLRRQFHAESAAPMQAAGRGAPAVSAAPSIPAPAIAAIGESPSNDIYPKWPWSWPVRGLRLLFTECVLRPLVRLLAQPRVESRIEGAAALQTTRAMLIVANHVTAFDVPLMLYALGPRIRRHIATAMAADILRDWRRMRNLGPAVLNPLGPMVYCLVTALFNVFPLPRSAGFRRSFQHAGEALDRGYNVVVFPEGHRTAGALAPFRPGIGLLVQESQTAVLPVGLAGLGDLKQRRRWFRSGQLTVRIGEPITFPSSHTPEQITEELHAAVAHLLE